MLPAIQIPLLTLLAASAAGVMLCLAFAFTALALVRRRDRDKQTYHDVINSLKQDNDMLREVLWAKYSLSVNERRAQRAAVERAKKRETELATELRKKRLYTAALKAAERVQNKAESFIVLTGDQFRTLARANIQEQLRRRAN